VNGTCRHAGYTQPTETDADRAGLRLDNDRRQADEAGLLSDEHLTVDGTRTTTDHRRSRRPLAPHDGPPVLRSSVRGPAWQQSLELALVAISRHLVER
jgi:hypothetical protein